MKVPLYARAGIAEVWLVDLRTNAIEVHRQPTPAGYGDARVLRRGEHLSPLAFPDLTLTVDDLFG